MTYENQLVEKNRLTSDTENCVLTCQEILRDSKVEREPVYVYLSLFRRVKVSIDEAGRVLEIKPIEKMPDWCNDHGTTNEDGS